MGKGNTLLRDENGESYNTYYIDYYEHDEEINEDTGEPYCNGEDCHCNESFNDDLLGNIRNIKGLDKEDHSFKEQLVIASNKVLEVVVADNESSCAIGCIPKLNDNELYNEFIFKRSANRVMQEVAKIYQLRVRCGPWTSRVVDKEEKEYY
jgi:hypothetical protein